VALDVNDLGIEGILVGLVESEGEFKLLVLRYASSTGSRTDPRGRGLAGAPPGANLPEWHILATQRDVVQEDSALPLLLAEEADAELPRAEGRHVPGALVATGAPDGRGLGDVEIEVRPSPARDGNLRLEGLRVSVDGRLEPVVAGVLDVDPAVEGLLRCGYGRWNPEVEGEGCVTSPVTPRAVRDPETVGQSALELERVLALPRLLGADCHGFGALLQFAGHPGLV